MPTRGTGDEIDALARTLDESFTALQDSLHRQTRFTADAAHELRNPISVVRNAAEVSLRQPRTPEEYREFLLDVLATSKRMENIVEALLLLARMDAGAIRRTFEPVDLAAIVGDAVAAQAAARDQIHYSNGAPGVVHGDGRLLRILVDNLLSNALRYSPARESVEVEVGTAGGEIRLRVKDHGPGFRRARRSGSSSASIAWRRRTRARPERGSGSRSCMRWRKCTRPSAASRLRCGNGSHGILSIRIPSAWIGPLRVIAGARRRRTVT